MPVIRPYKGLMPYGPQDAGWFYGREAESEIVEANLMAARLTVVYGASGAGKTSVLQAGVAHRLEQRAARNLARRGRPRFALVTFDAWREDPLSALRDRIRHESLPARETLAEPSPAGQSPLVDALRACAKQAGGPVYVILDQFEEYFLYHPQKGGEGTFADEFPRAVNRLDLPVHFVLSIRDDALSKLDRFQDRIPGLFDNYLRIDRLGREAARTAIVQPIVRYNQGCAAGEAPANIEKRLVEAVLDQLQAVRGVAPADVLPDAIEAIHLQLVMTRLWEEERGAGSHVLRLETLERLGNAEQIVRSHFENTVAALRPESQEIAARALYHLVTPSGTKIALTLHDLAALAEVEQAELEPVLETLSGPQTRILDRIPPTLDEPEVRYGLPHPVLVTEVLQKWEKQRPEVQQKWSEQYPKTLLGWTEHYAETRERTEAEAEKRI